MADSAATALLNGGFGSATYLFWACMVLAIGIVYLFCSKKFDERIDRASDDYVYQLAPSQLATRQEYRRGFLIYFLGTCAVVVVMALAGPKATAALFGVSIPAGTGDVVWPIGAALLVAGLMPVAPVLQEIEKWGRQYAHEVAYIPRSALATAERLSTAGFDFSLYADEAMESEELRGVDPADFKKSRRSLEYAWARLGCLVYAQNSLLMSGAGEAVDTELLQAYRKDLDLIQTSKKAMEAEVAAYRAEKAKNPAYANETLNRAIRNDLYKLYILFGCAVRIKSQPHGDINLALQRLGFQLEAGDEQRSNSDLVLVGIVACAAAELVIQFAAVMLGNLNLWDNSVVYPSDYGAVFYNTGWSLIPFGVAVVVADAVRNNAIGKGWWFGSNARGKRRNRANYVRVGLLCGVTGYVGLMGWDLLVAPPTITAFKLEVPNVLLAMVTGGFYVWHLDTVELGERSSRAWNIASQVFVTGLCGIIAATASWNVRLPELAEVGIRQIGDMFDMIALAALMSAVVGGVLAWYVPAAAAAAKVDPLAEALEERTHKLEMAAAARFGDTAAADRWMDQPLPALEQQSPRQAARGIDGFEHAMALLQQGPRAIAA
jgi:hypothetical protein